MKTFNSYVPLIGDFFKIGIVRSLTPTILIQSLLNCGHKVYGHNILAKFDNLTGGICYARVKPLVYYFKNKLMQAIAQKKFFQLLWNLTTVLIGIKEKSKYDWRHYRIFQTRVMSLFILKIACADNNLIIIAMKLRDSVNRHKRKIKFDWQYYGIFYARVIPLFQWLPTGNISNSLSSSS